MQSPGRTHTESQVNTIDDALGVLLHRKSCDQTQRHVWDRIKKSFSLPHQPDAVVSYEGAIRSLLFVHEGRGVLQPRAFDEVVVFTRDDLSFDVEEATQVAKTISMVEAGHSVAAVEI